MATKVSGVEISYLVGLIRLSDFKISLRLFLIQYYYYLKYPIKAALWTLAFFTNTGRTRNLNRFLTFLGIFGLKVLQKSAKISF